MVVPSAAFFVDGADNLCGFYDLFVKPPLVELPGGLQAAR
jgi:hypothetical protein